MVINGKITAFSDENIDKKLYADLWKEFSFHGSAIKIVKGESLCFSCGKAANVALSDGDEFAFYVTDDGFAVKGADSNGLRRGINALMARIERNGNGTTIPNGEVRGKFTSDFRAVHFCVFPETTIFDLDRFLRAAAVTCYTHAAVEFWGTLRYDSLRWLGFKNAFTKREIKKVFGTARSLGLEIIPFFNHLGHASQCRVTSGKHVVMDQKPEYARLFTPDGWAYDIGSEEVKNLLRNVRRELCELCGDGKYFHIGCDEPYIYDLGYGSHEKVNAYVADRAREVLGEGRLPIIWSDLLVPARFKDCYEIEKYTPIESDEKRVDDFAAILPKGTVLADWWYEIERSPVPTCERLKKYGFEIIGCPWETFGNIRAYHKTDGLKGVMLTTWHTLYRNYANLLINARLFGYPHNRWSEFAPARTETARILRAVKKPEKYERAGFCNRQITKDFTQ